MYRSARYMLVTALAALSIVACSASEHAVGNSLWSIPPSNDYYSNWSINRTFLVGDSLGNQIRLLLNIYILIDTSFQCSVSIQDCQT